MNRLAVALASCSTQYCNGKESSVSLFALEEGAFLCSLLQGKDVVEIGCGYDAGLSRELLLLGAKLYLGIDINTCAVESAKYKRKHKSNGTLHHARFICDDPINVLETIATDASVRPFVLSTAVFDDAILRDRKYARMLVTAIGRATKSGDYTLHSALSFEKYFGDLFEDAGFEYSGDALERLFGLMRKTR